MKQQFKRRFSISHFGIVEKKWPLEQVCDKTYALTYYSSRSHFLGFVYCATPIAGAISGLIAYGVESNLNGVRGLAAWQWLFIIDGVPTVAWGFLVWILLPRLPESEIASSKSLFFGTPEEKRLIRERNAAGHNVLQTKIHLWQTLVAIKDPKTWMLAFIVGTIAAALAAFGLVDTLLLFHLNNN